MTDTPAEHRIRLRGPWKYRWLNTNAPAVAEPQTFRHPEEWLDLIAGKTGRMELSRVFHAPTNMEPHEQLFVVLTGVHATGEVFLNGASLGPFDTHVNCYEFGCPLPLPWTNTLTIELAFGAITVPSMIPGLYDSVELVIRTPLRK